MAIGDLLHTMSSLLETCKKHVSHVTRRLRAHPSLSKLKLAAGHRRIKCRGGGVAFLSRGASFIPFLGNRGIPDEKERKFSDAAEEEGADAGVWQRAILMGEKCQPLNFSGAIHYDSSGRQLSTPRTPLRSPIPSFAFHEEDDDEEVVVVDVLYYEEVTTTTMH